MTKEITRAIIIQEMQDKLNLREFEPAPFLFDETVTPVYDIGQHLLKLERLTKTFSITATGAVSMHEVPDNEEWYLHRYNVIFETGAYTLAGVFVGRPLSTHYTYLDLGVGKSVSYINDLPKDVKLNSDDNVYVNVDGYTSTGNLTLIVEVTKEIIR